MDYKEKYEEALERMRYVIIPPETKEGLQALKETVFPELRESEDERIRKEIISFLNRLPGDGQLDQEISRIVQTKRLGDWLAYLEKQKEKSEKPIIPVGGEDEKTRKDLIVEVLSWEGIPETKRKEFVSYLEKIDSKWSPSEDEMGVLYKLCYISKQVTDEDDTELTRLYQDLKREYFNGHSFENMFPSEKQKEPQPAGWSSLDKACHNVIHDTIRGKFVPAGALRQATDWFDSLPERFTLTPKQEWSEEDEKIRSAILLMMKVPRKEIFEARGITKEQVLDWLERQKKTEGGQIIASAKSGHGCQATAPPWDPETEHQCDCEHVGCHINNCRRWCRRYMAEIPYTNCSPTCSGYSQKNTGGISVKKPTWTGNDSMALVSLEAIINNSNHDEARKKELLDWLLTRVQNGFSPTPEEKEFVRTIRSLVADFIHQKEEVDTSYYQRLVDWVEKRHIESIEPLWTPTEAQMWALQEAVARSCSSEYGGPLSDMLEMLNRSLGRKTAWEKCKPGATDDNAVAFVYPYPEAWRFANEGTKFSEDMLVVGADREPRMSRCAVNKCYYLPTSKILPPRSVTDKLVAQYGESHGEPAPGGIKSDQ